MTDDELTQAEFSDGEREFMDAVHSLVNELLAQDGAPQIETPMQSVLFAAHLWHEAMVSAEGLKRLNKIAEMIHPTVAD